MNQFEVVDLTTSGQLGTGNPTVGSRSSSILVGMESSRAQSVEESLPMHFPREEAMGQRAWEWWVQPQNIGGWVVDDVLALPDGNGNWIYEADDFNGKVGRYMAKYGEEDSFPYVMSSVWNKPRFRMMWYDMVISCVHPNLMANGPGVVKPKSQA